MKTADNVKISSLHYVYDDNDNEYFVKDGVIDGEFVKFPDNHLLINTLYAYRRNALRVGINKINVTLLGIRDREVFDSLVNLQERMRQSLSAIG